MRRLVIDSATESCSVALFDNDTLIAGECLTLGRGHAERLVPMIAALPGNGRADHIAVDTGPGSFTGIRVGLAAARALALAWGAHVEGYASLTLVAAMARRERPGTAVDVVMTGGHGEWFMRSFGADGAPVTDLCSLTPDAAATQSRAPLVAGSQAEALAGRRGDAPAFLPILPDARAFGLLAAHDLVADPVAVYGRPPDARLPQAG
ncbi:tRNA (adenosine(37)-N6)-threonylcarbamoyltransferase complex dimerization subunit type 1 TsaB [Novosphingobium sp. KCTC 2891]|uniref:tRNA (adenosine(37)-N6)-threonylcarbamoyltransferase complex dimerization subunit type 1 TsaB n=1 Tax=Novosphingobium sp. KCTC 2891 TaxID=2989730 RepID=UPI002222BBA1|nr:tRNA (adenosine(37)-N6)-threonylcarbamoyltransferase complex dimerization subunit type 1 TsaB [Novosphingobium sp. KCTC 2891]MCW1382628.1 tRNA (adenosine(37)-N6)-threonylcarbamoyltransferase complex dimerization subunit type 1 TsaB [Novosphingobium sp. KCTC 2891]